MKKTSMALVGFAMSLQFGALHANAEKSANQKDASSKSTGSIGDFFRFFKNPKDENPVISAIKASVASLPKAQLVTSYKESIYAHPDMLDAITRIYVGRDASQSDAYIEQLITSARDEKFSDEWRKIKQTDDIEEIIKRLVLIVDPEIQLAALLKELKVKPEKMAILLVSFISSTADSQAPSTIAKNVRETFIDTYKTGFPAATLGLLALAGAAGGGGGGGGTTTCWGGPCTPSYAKASFETTEYNNQYGLGMIKASSVYQYGGFGDGVTVAVFDTGIRTTHSAFTGRIADGGYDYVTNSVNVTSDGTSGHGSHVSGIIAGNKNDNTNGMHGVAYNSKIMPFKILGTLNGAWSSDTSLAHAVARSYANGAFINNHSWGISVGGNGVLINDANRLAYLNNYTASSAAFIQSVANGAVHVWAAGNDGQSEVGIFAGVPVLTSAVLNGWVAVAAVGTDGVIASYSNRCGVAANWCIAAPGTTVKSVDISSDSAYINMSGTSMAAPHVSGAIAALKTRFPNLTFQQVRDRIFVTANKTGIYATTTIYGQGLMDLDAAASPVGSLSVPTALSSNGTSQSLGSSSLVLPQGVVLSGLPAEVLVLDSFQNAPFYISSSSLIKNKRKQLGFDYTNILDEDVNIKQDGIDIRLGKNLSEMNVDAGDKSVAFSVGYLNNSYTNNKSLPSTLLNSNKNSMLVGYGAKKNNYIIRAYSWSELNQPQDGQVKTNLKQVSFLPSFVSGTAMSYESSLSASTNVVTGMGIAKTGGKFDDFIGTGAFNLNPKLATSHWVGFNSSSIFGEIKSDSSIKLTQWNIKQDMANSLLKSSENLRVNDIEISTNFKSRDARTSATISLGVAKVTDSGSYSIAVPTTIDESGVISYLNASVSKKSLFNESRGQFKLSHVLNASSTISTFYGFRENQQMEHLLGIGLNIKFK